MAVLVGLAVGLVLGLVAVFANVPMIVLVVVGSIAGAVGVTGGLMLLVGSLDSADFSRGDFTDTVSGSFGWSFASYVTCAATHVVLAVAIGRGWIADHGMIPADTIEPRNQLFTMMCIQAINSSTPGIDSSNSRRSSSRSR